MAANDCEQCEADAILRVLAVRDYLEFILWGEVAPLEGIDTAIQGLGNAQGLFLQAGHAR